MQQNPARRACLILLTVAVFCGSGWAASIPGALPDQAMLPPRVDTRLAWRAALPLRSVEAVKSCHLLEGYLYAITDGGNVHCVKADTGRLLWSRQLEPPPGVIYPPVVYRSTEFYGVAFTLSREVLLLDPETGSEYKRIRLLTPASASCSTAPGLIFSAETNRRLRTYDVKDNVQAWQILGEGPMVIPPVYQPDLQTVALADESGLVAMVWGTDKEEVYARRLGGAPEGWIASDVNDFYVATSDNLVNCLNRITGKTEWQYRLPAKPEGGPVVCGGSIFQAVAPCGIQEISINRERPNWFDADAVKFVSKWEGRPALLHRDGRIAVVDTTTGKPAAFIETGPVADAVTNTSNEALLLLSASGEIRCLQAAEASPAALASFLPPTTQPTTQPATDQPTSRPVLARKPKPSEQSPLWTRSSATAQQGATASTGRSSRRDRSDRSSARSSRSSRSSRGDRSSRSSRSERRSSRDRGSRSPRSSGGY